MKSYLAVSYCFVLISVYVLSSPKGPVFPVHATRRVENCRRRPPPPLETTPRDRFAEVYQAEIGCQALRPEGLQGAVSINYDEASPRSGPSRPGKPRPAGTFYTFHQPGAWRDVAGKSHGLGSHSIFHPKDQDWLRAEYDLSYTPGQWSGGNTRRQRHPGRSRPGGAIRKHLRSGGRGGSAPRAADRGTVRLRPGPLNNGIVGPATIDFNALGHSRRRHRLLPTPESGST